MHPIAARDRLVLVAPQSTSATWDVIAGGYGPDIRRIDPVEYQEFDGPHTVPAVVVERAGAWLREHGVG